MNHHEQLKQVHVMFVSIFTIMFKSNLVFKSYTTMIIVYHYTYADGFSWY